MATLRYHKIDKCDFNNGDGARVVLWVSGCEHKCEGCHNPQTWSEKSGKYFQWPELDIILNTLKDDAIDGLTITGGDPLAPYNSSMLYTITAIVKSKYPNKNIWVWTGYKFEDLNKNILKHIDVIIDGKYEKDNPTNKKYRGSDNQRMWKNENYKWSVID